MSKGDDQELGSFGYAQELFRNMGGFSNFAISFSIISILTGAVTLFGYGLEMGGPLEMSLGWPVATLFTLTLAASMAELCSAYPTSGAMCRIIPFDTFNLFYRDGKEARLRELQAMHDSKTLTPALRSS